MDINDLYYNKYIKYKTKYLELKEQSGNGFFTSNLELYGPNYNDLDQCIIKTEVIKKIIEVKGIPYIKKIIEHENKKRLLQSNQDDNYIVDVKTINIIKNSKIEILSKESNKNLKDLRVDDIDNVLNRINYVLFDLILPELYYEFEKKLGGKIEFTIELEKRYPKIYTSLKDLDKEIIEKLRKEIKTQIKVKENNENKKNIDNIVQVYKFFGNIITKYNNNEYNKENVNNETETDKKKLLNKLQDIQPKVPMLIKIVELYFEFLKIYIIYDIKPKMYDTYIYEKNLTSILDRSIDKKKLFLYKVYENIYNGKIENFFNNIKKIDISTSNIESTKNDLIQIFNDLKQIFNIDSYRYYNQDIIDDINLNYDNRNLDRNNINNNYNPSKWYIYYESLRWNPRWDSESPMWREYYNKNRNLFKIDNIPLLLKKSINIYLYKIFIFLKNKYLKEYKNKENEIIEQPQKKQNEEENEKQLYTEEVNKLITDFFKPFFDEKTDESLRRKSSREDINKMYTELVQILNKIKDFNTNIENLVPIITIIKSSYTDFENFKKKDEQQYYNYKRQIWNLLITKHNSRISKFVLLSRVINTYLYLMIQSNLGNYNINTIQY